MKTTTKEKIREFLKNVHSQIDINDYVDIDEIDINRPFESIREILNENVAFDIEIIYYSNAINYLRENDPSLENSLEIASEFGYQLTELNSEMLASLLASRKAEEEFEGLDDEINEFFESIEDELSDDDDDDESPEE